MREYRTKLGGPFRRHGGGPARLQARAPLVERGNVPTAVMRSGCGSWSSPQAECLCLTDASPASTSRMTSENLYGLPSRRVPGGRSYRWCRPIAEVTMMPTDGQRRCTTWVRATPSPTMRHPVMSMPTGAGPSRTASASAAVQTSTVAKPACFRVSAMAHRTMRSVSAMRMVTGPLRDPTGPSSGPDNSVVARRPSGAHRQGDAAAFGVTPNHHCPRCTRRWSPRRWPTWPHRGRRVPVSRS